MKNYLQNSLIKLRKVGERIASSSFLSDTSWLLLTEDNSTKIIYIFKSIKNELYVSFNGNIKKGKWEYIVDSDSLVIDTEEGIELYNASLLQNDFLFLKKDGSAKALVFANFTKYKDLLNKDIYKIFNKTKSGDKKEVKIKNNDFSEVPSSHTTDADEDYSFGIILILIVIFSSLFFLIWYSRSSQ